MLGKGKFKSWLEDFPSDSIVRASNSLIECPAANFLKCMLCYGVLVYQLGYIAASETERRVLNLMPTWMRKFINLVDLNKKGAVIPAKEALEILAKIKEN